MSIFGRNIRNDSPLIKRHGKDLLMCYYKVRRASNPEWILNVRDVGDGEYLASVQAETANGFAMPYSGVGRSTIYTEAIRKAFLDAYPSESDIKYLNLKNVSIPDAGHYMIPKEWIEPRLKQYGPGLMTIFK